MKNEKEANDEKKKKEKDGKHQVPGSKTTVGSTSTLQGPQNSKSTQTKPPGTGQIAAVTRSSPSFVSRTLTVIQDEGNQEGQDQTIEAGGNDVGRSEDHRDPRRTSTGAVARKALRPVESRSTQADIQEPVSRSVHQVVCARSRHVCKGSTHKGVMAQRGCCADEVRVLPDGVVVGCCADEADKQNGPTVYRCRKTTGFPDSVYPTSSGLFCCHGTWKEEPVARQAKQGTAGELAVRSFVGMCCTHALPTPKEVGDEDVAELTTAVVELETAEDTLDGKKEEDKGSPK